ncbi:MAG: hypothetical protein CMF49_05715 [Legionellales bacterium]|nr:hypothetical protein [Legionellales bacterium]
MKKRGIFTLIILFFTVTSFAASMKYNQQSGFSYTGGDYQRFLTIQNALAQCQQGNYPTVEQNMASWMKKTGSVQILGMQNGSCAVNYIYNSEMVNPDNPNQSEKTQNIMKCQFSTSDLSVLSQQYMQSGAQTIISNPQFRAQANQILSQKCVPASSNAQQHPLT